MSAGSQRTGAVVGLRKVGGVCSSDCDAANGERRVPCVLELYALGAAGCADILTAKRKAGGAQGGHRANAGACKTYVLRTAASIIGNVQGGGAISTRDGSKRDAERATGSHCHRGSAVIALGEVARIRATNGDSSDRQRGTARICQSDVLRWAGYI